LNAQNDVRPRDVMNALRSSPRRFDRNRRKGLRYRYWSHLVRDGRRNDRNQTRKEKYEDPRPFQCPPDHERGTLQDRFHNVSIS
jgi:hypothetical protein